MTTKPHLSYIGTALTLALHQIPEPWLFAYSCNPLTMLEPIPSYHRWMQIVVPVSLIGLPAINLPAGFCKNKLPFGIQLIGKQFSDNNLLKIAESWHSATSFPEKYPPTFIN